MADMIEMEQDNGLDNRPNPKAYDAPWCTFKVGEIIPIHGWWFRVVGADYEQDALVLTPVEPCRRTLQKVGG